MVTDPSNGQNRIKALEDDREWFDRHIHRNFRFRDPKEFEFGGPFFPIADTGEKLLRLVVTRRSDDGQHVRARILIPLFSKRLDDNDGAIEELLNRSDRFETHKHYRFIPPPSLH